MVQDAAAAAAMLVIYHSPKGMEIVDQEMDISRERVKDRKGAPEGKEDRL